jgi:anthranilate synthase/aminodeoxychorismate synthase-like glutamine amidotransferase
MRIALVDNFDSFTFNLVEEFARRGCTVDTVRNSISLADLEQQLHRWRPSLLVFSPGPGHPRDAGCCLAAIRRFAGQLPIFGVCLGHQAMVEAFGGKVGAAAVQMHGKSSLLRHQSQGLYRGLPNPLQVGRYHSLVASELPEVLVADAWCGETVMGVHHATLPLYGVQYHPESILTPRGGLLIDNLLACLGAKE